MGLAHSNSFGALVVGANRLLNDLARNDVLRHWVRGDASGHEDQVARLNGLGVRADGSGCGYQVRVS